MAKTHSTTSANTASSASTQASLATRFFGRPSWAPAPWMVRTQRFAKQRPVAFMVVLLLLAAACAAVLAGWQYYQSLPQPLRWQASVVVPGISDIPEDADETPVVEPLKITFAPADGREASEPARLDLIDQRVYEGVGISPHIAGEWRWEDGRTLVFDPDQAWPANSEYQITFGPQAFADSAQLAQQKTSFTTPAFTASLENIEFKQDPVQRQDRRVFATLEFSHAVQAGPDNAALKQAIELGMRPSGATRDAKPTAQAFEVSLGAHGRKVYIKSAALELPAQANTMRLTLARDLHSAAGDAPLKAAVHGEVRIPDRESYFRVEEAAINMLRDREDAPRQTLLLNLTDDIASAPLAQNLKAYLLPKREKGNRWSRPGQVSAEVLDRAQAIQLKPQPLPREHFNVHSYALDLPPGRQVYVQLKAGVESAHGFSLASDYAQVLTLPSYPREVKIRAQGALLSRSGQRQLSLLARGLPGIKVEIGRVLPGSINHLVSQTGGDLSAPDFQNYHFSADDIVRWESKIIPLAAAHPRDPVFATLDLAPWLKSELGSSLGLFFIRVNGWDPAKNRAIYTDSDERLVLVSDLGLLVKRSADNSDQVFVQSVSSGAPVADAQVQLLGRNGQPIFQGRTNADGRVDVPNKSREYNARRPTVYVVRNGEDTAFIPWQRAERRLGYSRFDVGGAYGSALADDALNAYLFSDRGIYRPGEVAHVGVVIRRNDLAYQAGIPLEVVITDPKGATAFTQRRKIPSTGFFEVKYQSEAWSPTGDYQAQVYLVNSRGNRSSLLGSTGLRVEEFQPDKLRIKSEYLSADKKPAAGWISPADLHAEVTLRNLFGTPAQDRRVTGEIRLTPAQFRFDAFPGYRFTDPERDAEQSRADVQQTLAETRTNAEGIARFDLNLARFERGLWRVNFFAEGFEAGGGRGVATARTALVSPAAQLVGVKADGDLDYIRRGSERRLELIAIDNQLQKTGLEDLTLRRSKRVPVSTLVQADDGSYSYQTLQQREPLETREYRLPASGDALLLDTTTPGDYVLDVLSADGQVLATRDYTVAGASNLAARLERSVELDLVLDKQKYTAGDEIELQITAPYTGAGLITIERDKVYAQQWFKTDTRRSIQRIRIPSELEGNAYVNVSFLRAIDSPEVYASPLSYAVAPFALNRDKRALEVSVDAPELARPGEAMRINYTVNQPARIAVFAVDEGILQVANYSTPSPLDYFLQKRALEVDTQQILDLLLPEIRLLQSTAAAGGGEGAANYLGNHLNPFARRGYEPAVFWSGVQDVTSGSGQFEYTPPDNFNGSLRVMAVAISENRMGAARDDALVRAPFVITPSLPASVAPGDEFQVSVGLSNVLKDAGTLAIELNVEAAQGLQLVNAKPVVLTLDEGSEGRAVFRVKALNKLGPASLRFSASAQPDGGTRVSSRLTSELSIRPATVYRSTVQAGYAQNGKVAITLERELRPALASVVATASNSPLAVVSGLNGYLAKFPHLCSEQIVSRVFPLLTFIDQPQYIARYTGEGGNSLDAVIRDLAGRQLASGGFALWPGQGRAQAWASVYAMLFLMQAQKRGQPVSNAVLDRGRQYLRDVAAKPSRSMAAARVRAQAIYLLAESGEQISNDLVHLHEGLERDHSKHWRGDVVAAWMAASYALLQETAEAHTLVEAYTTGRDSGYKLAAQDSVLAHDAQYLWLMAQQFPKRLQRLEPAFLQRMLQPVFSGGYNSLSAAWTVFALGAYQSQIEPLANQEVTFNAVDAEGSPVPVSALEAAYPQVELATIVRKLSIAADDSLFYSLQASGYDRMPATQTLSQGMEIDRSYLNADGEPLQSFKQGQEITVRLRVRSSEDAVENAVIVDLLPGGFTVDTDSLSRDFGGWRADYIDVRDDRVVVYGRVDTRTREIRYQVRATTAGSFSLAPVSVASLYNREHRAHGAAGRVEVTPASTQ